MAESPRHTSPEFSDDSVDSQELYDCPDQKDVPGETEKTKVSEQDIQLVQDVLLEEANNSPRESSDQFLQLQATESKEHIDQIPDKKSECPISEPSMEMQDQVEQQSTINQEDDRGKADSKTEEAVLGGSCQDSTVLSGSQETNGEAGPSRGGLRPEDKHFKKKWIEVQEDERGSLLDHPSDECTSDNTKKKWIEVQKDERGSLLDHPSDECTSDNPSDECTSSCGSLREGRCSNPHYGFYRAIATRPRPEVVESTRAHRQAIAEFHRAQREAAFPACCPQQHRFVLLHNLEDRNLAVQPAASRDLESSVDAAPQGCGRKMSPCQKIALAVGLILEAILFVCLLAYTNLFAGKSDKDPENDQDPGNATLQSKNDTSFTQ